MVWGAHRRTSLECSRRRAPQPGLRGGRYVGPGRAQEIPRDSKRALGTSGPARRPPPLVWSRRPAPSVSGQQRSSFFSCLCLRGALLWFAQPLRPQCGARAAAWSSLLLTRIRPPRLCARPPLPGPTRPPPSGCITSCITPGHRCWSVVTTAQRSSRNNTLGREWHAPELNWPRWIIFARPLYCCV